MRLRYRILIVGSAKHSGMQFFNLNGRNKKRCALFLWRLMQKWEFILFGQQSWNYAKMGFLLQRGQSPVWLWLRRTKLWDSAIYREIEAFVRLNIKKIRICIEKIMLTNYSKQQTGSEFKGQPFPHCSFLFFE
jgi:hypothetical protein